MPSCKTIRTILLLLDLELDTNSMHSFVLVTVGCSSPNIDCCNNKASSKFSMASSYFFHRSLTEPRLNNVEAIPNRTMLIFLILSCIASLPPSPPTQRGRRHHYNGRKNVREWIEHDAAIQQTEIYIYI